MAFIGWEMGKSSSVAPVGKAIADPCKPQCQSWKPGFPACSCAIAEPTTNLDTRLINTIQFLDSLPSIYSDSEASEVQKQVLNPDSWLLGCTSLSKETL
jgi:hypothetical protein